MVNHPNRSKPTAFMQFWDTMNRELERRHLPEMTFRNARDLWRQAVDAAVVEHFQSEIGRLGAMEGARR